MTEISLLTNPVRRYLTNLNNRRKMAKMYPNHPMQKWERVMVAVFVVLMFAGLILSFHQTAEAEAMVAERDQEFLDFLNRRYVLTAEDGHTVYAEKIEIGKGMLK